MKRIVYAQRTTQKMMASFKSDQFKDEFHIIEMENEIKALEPVYNSMATDFEQLPAVAKYVCEIERMWDALKRSQANSKILSETVKEHMATISAFNLKTTAANEANQNDQKIINKLQQEVQRALRMVDTAHTREQVAQETVENLRQQISRLHQELELKSKSADQDGEYSSIAKNKDALIKERERMANEIVMLRDKLNSSKTYQEELERKNSFADLRVAELTQELENQTNEMSKESRFKERFEDDLVQVKKELVIKESEISHLNAQVLDFQRSTTLLQNTIKEQKTIMDRMHQTTDSHQQRIVKLTDELQRESALFDDCNQKIILLNKQMKLKDELAARLMLDLTKITKVQESFKKKLNKMEVEKMEVIDEKRKLEVEIDNLQRRLENDRQDLNNERKKVEGMMREKEIINKNALRSTAMLSEQARVAKIQEQARLHLEQEIDNNRFDLAKQAQELTALEKEKDRYVSETVVLTKKVEAAMEDVKLQQCVIYDYKKKLTKLETQVANKTMQYESVRYELNTCSKNLLEAQDDIIDLKQKAKVMTLQIEQLKDDIAGKETQLIREQLALRKAHGEKEAMRVEINKFKDQLEDSKEVISLLNSEIETLQNVVRQADSERERDRKEKEKLMNDKDILSTQLVRRNDEVTLLREKLKIFQSTMDKEEVHYTQRMEDIRLLKLEVKKLNSEKQVLTSSLENMVDLRSEVHHLEKNLTKERLKSRALQDEQQNPLNIHRWRKLEGSDPASLELVQKVRVQQRRILEQTKSMLNLEEKYSNLEKQYKIATSRQPVSEDTIELQRELKLRENKIKGLTAELNMREAQAVDYRAELDKLNQDLADLKKKFYDQKQKAEKLVQKLEASKVLKPDITVSQSKFSNGTDVLVSSNHELPVLPQKPRFTGGGFNMGVAAS